jgi:uncharacterized protein (AIM24 family)
VCRYCRLPIVADGLSCPNCGAPLDVEDRVTSSGWEEQPPIADMARIKFGRSTCQVEGTLVPTADMNLVDDDGVYFSHHVLLWMEPTVNVDNMAMAGGWNRMMSGMPLVMVEAHAPGHIAFSADSPGEIVAVPLQPGQAMDVTQHRFLVATTNVGFSWYASNIWYSSGDETHYPIGMNVDRFSAAGEPGLLLLHCPGNTFLRDLAPGETICIQPGALLYKDPSVGMQLHVEYPANNGASFFGGYTNRTVWLRLWGPGRVAMSSVFERPEPMAAMGTHSPATEHHW